LEFSSENVPRGLFFVYLLRAIEYGDIGDRKSGLRGNSGGEIKAQLKLAMLKCVYGVTHFDLSSIVWQKAIVP
jgi:hypothetical protein